MAEKRYTISVIWPEHTGAGTIFPAAETFEHCIIIRNLYSFLEFEDKDGNSHIVSAGFPFHARQEKP